MSKVVIWGTGKTALKALNYIRPEVEILGFADSYANDGQEFFNKKVVRPDQLVKRFSFDVLIICSIYKEEIQNQISILRIDKEKVFWWNEFEMQQYSAYKKDPFHNKLKRLEGKDELQLIITGISYHNDGISEDVFKVPALNFAMKGQDLFYDFEIVKLLHKEGRLSHLKYAIIGLCYYSFELDLSKTVNKWEIIRYYPEIETGHNLIEQAYWNIYCETEIKKWQSKESYDLFTQNLEYDFSDAIGKATAYDDFNKNYPITVFENKMILKEYLSFLEQLNVIPIIVIMPATQYYTKYCNKSIIEKFYSDLQDVIGERQIQILDYFDKCEYPEGYYYHINHLNADGAVVFTKQLEKDIVW